MGKRSILKDISVDELLKMREAGMSNRDIANALGICYATVLKYIGPECGRGGTIAKGINTTAKAPEHLELALQNVVTKLKGQVAEYEISSADQCVNICIKGWDSITHNFYFNLDELKQFIIELKEIEYRMAREEKSE